MEPSFTIFCEDVHVNCLLGLHVQLYMVHIGIRYIHIDFLYLIKDLILFFFYQGVNDFTAASCLMNFYFSFDSVEFRAAVIFIN